MKHLLLITILAHAIAFSQTGMPKFYFAYRAITPVNLDGNLNDAAWQKAAWTDTFVDIEGDKNPLPRFLTRAKMVWDDNYFYIAAELQEPHVWGTITKRDSVIYYDNDFEVFIDPNGDNHQYYELEMNALNTVWDLFLPKPYRDGGKAMDGWDIIGLKTAVQVQGTPNNPADRDSGWTVEIAMPWDVLSEFAHKPCPPQNGDQWRINFSRVEWKHEIVGGIYRRVPKTREDNWVWSPQGVVDMHRPERWGYVQFSTEPSGSARFKPDSTWRLRELLYRVYYAQKSFFDKNKRWAGSLKELELVSLVTEIPNCSVTVAPEADGYTATAEMLIPGSNSIKVNIRQDSLIW
jgi:hypothetical protein